MRVSAAVAAQVAQAISPTGQASARSMPRKVATPLPPRKPSQTGKRCPRKAAAARDQRRVLADEARGRRRTADRALAGVEDQGRGRRALVAGAQHVGRADVARPDLAQVAEAERAGDEQAEGDRAEQVGEATIRTTRAAR